MGCVAKNRQREESLSWTRERRQGKAGVFQNEWMGSRRVMNLEYVSFCHAY